jgi:branched-chain amino acid transport system permease protein
MKQSVIFRKYRGYLHAAWGAIALFICLAAPAMVYAAQGGSSNRLITIMFINMILVIGLQTFTGNSGILSFGHISFAAIGAYVTAILTAPPSIKSLVIPDAPFGLAEVQLDPAVAFVIAILITTLLASPLGVIIVRLKPLGATIVTLSMLIVVHALLINWKSLTGGAEAFYGIPRIPITQWVLAAGFVVILAAKLFRVSPIGLRLQAAREDELAATAMGIKVTAVRWVAWVLSAAIIAWSGALRAHFLTAINPDEFFLNLTFLIVAMLILGGAQSVTGAVAGTVVVTIGEDIMRSIGDGPEILGIQIPQISGLSLVFLGAVVMGGMIWRPRGIVGDLEVEQILTALVARWRRGQKLSAEKFRHIEPGPGPNTGQRRLNPERLFSLEVKNVIKDFVGLRAVDKASLQVRQGEIVGLIGPNGAGKTTLLNIISGILLPTAGEIEFKGQNITSKSAAEIGRAGIARTFQTIRLFKELTTRQNIEVSASIATQHRQGNQPIMTAEAALAHFDLTDLANRKAGTLAYGAQRRVEMARAIALAPDILLLDEPAAGMTEVESTWLMEAIRGVRDRFGCGILVVDHDLHFVMNLCDRIFVMNKGSIIARGTPQEVQRDPAVIEAYLGSKAVQQKAAQV